jgi:predicted HTH transcriptional regulator
MNAIMHRDYESNAPVKFYQFTDRIEIVNPGGLYGNARPENFPNVNDYRNPVIAEAMKVLGYVNRFNRGIARVKVELKENGNLGQMIDELFEIVSSSNSIHTIIKYSNNLKSKYAAELLEYYRAAIEIQAEHTGRNIYSALVQYLKQMAELKGGLHAAKALKEPLLNKYKNRPAMKKEFKNINW